MLPAEETPLERVERDLDWLKRLADIVISTARPRGQAHLGPWEGLDEPTKELLLGGLDWSGVEPADRLRIMEREVDHEAIHADIFYPFRRKATR
jgi:hypothetical protein